MGEVRQRKLILLRHIITIIIITIIIIIIIIIITSSIIMSIVYYQGILSIVNSDKGGGETWKEVSRGVGESLTENVMFGSARSKAGRDSLK